MASYYQNEGSEVPPNVREWRPVTADTGHFFPEQFNEDFAQWQNFDRNPAQPAEGEHGVNWATNQGWWSQPRMVVPAAASGVAVGSRPAWYHP